MTEVTQTNYIADKFKQKNKDKKDQYAEELLEAIEYMYNGQSTFNEKSSFAENVTDAFIEELKCANNDSDKYAWIARLGTLISEVHIHSHINKDAYASCVNKSLDAAIATTKEMPNYKAELVGRIGHYLLNAGHDTIGFSLSEEQTIPLLEKFAIGMNEILETVPLENTEEKMKIENSKKDVLGNRQFSTYIPEKIYVENDIISFDKTGQDLERSLGRLQTFLHYRDVDTKQRYKTLLEAKIAAHSVTSDLIPPYKTLYTADGILFKMANDKINLDPPPYRLFK